MYQNNYVHELSESVSLFKKKPVKLPCVKYIDLPFLIIIIIVKIAYI